jgi:hypothetical protein
VVVVPCVGHGFKFAPVIGDIIADVVENKPNSYKAKFAWRQRPADDLVKTEACRTRVNGPSLLQSHLNPAKL